MPKIPIEIPIFEAGTTLDVAPITVLLGYNGVGKSSLLEHIKTTRYDVVFFNKLATKRFLLPLPEQDVSLIVKKYIYGFIQPELGIHPNLHGDMAENLVNAMRGIDSCAIVETHSECFVLRLRALVAERKLRPEDVSINFVIRGQAPESTLSYIKKIDLDTNGELSDWEHGFFDENLKEILRMDKAIAYRTPLN